MTADADRPSAEEAAREFLCNLPGSGRAYGAGRIVYESEVAALLTAREAALLARAESAETALANHLRKCSADTIARAIKTTAERDALAAQVGVLRAALDKSYNGPEADLPRTVERLLHNTAEAAARRDEAIRASERERLLAGDAVPLMLVERKRQDEKWGEQNHAPMKWAAILTEEVGEVAKATLNNDEREYLAEMVQVGAVAIAAIESLGRQAALSPGTADAGER